MLPLADMVFWGGCLRSESSCIQVNLVYFCHVVTSLGFNQSITGPLQDEIAGIMQLYTVCLESKCTDFLFKYLLDLPEITSDLLQSMTLGKIHSGSNASSTVHSSTGSHFP